MNKSFNSSVLKSATYNNGNLNIEFNNGRTTSYVGVPEDKARNLMEASSPGSFYATNIRSQYSHG